ncbi:MAG: helix-turn-helix domain-containing protein [Pseudonocardia sp.]
MTRQPERRRGELARLCAELRGQGCTYREIAGRIRGELRVNARVAFRLAHGLTQAEVAERWNAKWPDQEALKTDKQISYWEVWPAPSGRRPSLDTLNKLAFLYQCSAGELLDGQDHSHLDPAASALDRVPERSGEPSPTAPAVPLPAASSGTGHPSVSLSDPAGFVATGCDLWVPERFATQLAAPVGGLIAVAGGTLGWSARQRDAVCQQLVDLFALWGHTMDRRIVLQLLISWAAAAAAGPVFPRLNPDDQQRLVAAVRAPSRVDATVIDHLEQVLSHCVRQDDVLGPQAVLDTVLAQRHLVGGLLAECPPALRPRLLSVHADQSRVTGWLSYNSNDFDGAATYYEQARTDAHEAHDTALGAQVLCQMSQLATWQQRPRVGIDHAVAAQRWAQRTDDLLLRAWAAATVARAYARDGQQSACLAELDTARAGIAAATGQPSVVAGVFDEGLHASIRGECLLQLHRPADAAQATERSLATLDRTYVRNVALTTVDLGSARLECGDLDHAAATLEQAADLAVQNRSARLAGEIHAVRARMQPWQDSGAVIQLDERLRAYQLV